MKGFQTITDEYKRKHFSKGYFGSIKSKADGIGMIICGIVLAALGVLAGMFPVYMVVDIIKGTPDAKFEAAPFILFVVVALAFLVPGVLIVVSGFKRACMKEGDWIKRCIECSNYPESVIRDFDSQIQRTDAVMITSDSVTSILTTDYLLYGNRLNLVLMKAQDIREVCQVDVYYSINVNGKSKRVHELNIGILSKAGTSMRFKADREQILYLLFLLQEKNPDIEFSDSVYSESEFDDMRNKNKENKEA